MSAPAPDQSAALGLGHDLHTPNRTLVLGPSPSLGQGCVRIEVELDGEIVVDLRLDVGLGHRGLEKTCEDRSWYQIVPYVERLNPDAACLAATAYCQAVEALLGLEVPARACWLRVLAGELSRVASHLGRIAATSLVLQASTPAHYALQARERVWDLLEDLCGARVGYGFVRIGGVARAMPGGFPQRCREALPILSRGLREVDALLGGNRLFCQRLEKTGVLSGEDCVAWSISGPVARAAGVARDLRRAEPGPVYDELEFDVPIGRRGDNLDRYRVYVEEIRQSLGLIEQCAGRLESLGAGDFASDDPRIVWPARARRPESSEAMTAHTLAVTEGPLVPEGEAGAAVESANGELGFHLVADGTCRPARLRCRAPSFFHLQPLGSMLRGAPLADLMPTFVLLGVVGAECDR